MTKSKSPLPFVTFLKRHKKNITQWVFFIVLFVGVYSWQHKGLLPTNGTQQAPEFVLPTLNHSIVRYQNPTPLDSMKSHGSSNDQQATVFYFFAPWCGVCHASIDNLNHLEPLIKQGKIKLFIIALDWQSKEEVEAFVAQHQLPARILLGTQSTANDFNIKGFPTYYIADRNGMIRWSSIGYSTGIGIELKTQQVLNRSF